MRKWLFALVFGLAVWVGGTPTPLQAADTMTPIATLGGSLTATQKARTLEVLEQAAGVDQPAELTVTGSTLVKYLNPSGAHFTADSGVWSSALVQKTGSGGINVTIVKYDGGNNITTITADQYRNAALTAGVTNAHLYITSAVRIDGSGALAGVYAAFAQNGQALNADQITAAQNEVAILSDITQENADKSGYSDKQLNNAVAGMKAAMAEQSKSGDKTLAESQITTIVDDQLQKNQLTTVITSDQRTAIIQLMIKIQSVGVLNNSGFKDQAQKLGASIQTSAKALFADLSKKLNTQENRNFLQKIWDAIVNFFNGLVHWVTQLF